MTRADRLNKLVSVVAPLAAQCPYVIVTLKDDRRRISLTCDDGDVISGSGQTVEDALATLEAKLAARMPAEQKDTK